MYLPPPECKLLISILYQRMHTRRKSSSLYVTWRMINDDDRSNVILVAKSITSSISIGIVTDRSTSN